MRNEDEDLDLRVQGKKLILFRYFSKRKTARLCLAESAIILFGLVCKVTSKYRPQPLKSHMQSCGTLRQFLKFPNLQCTNSVV